MTNELQEIRKEMREGQLQLEMLKKEVQRIRLDASSSDDDAGTKFVVENIDSIMGLREALTSRSRVLRVIWTILITLGLAATVYYLFRNTKEYLYQEKATKSGLVYNDNYTLPDLVICPPWPFDMGQQESKGLDSEALVYSMGYMGKDNRYLDMESPKVKKLMEEVSNDSSTDPWILAKNRFFSYYKKSEFQSAMEYFESLLVDVKVEPIESINASSNSSLFIENVPCYESIVTNLTRSAERENKAIFQNGLCYHFPLQNATPRNTQDPGSLTMINFDRTNGVSNHKNAWSVDFADTISPRGPAIVLEPFFEYTLKLDALRIVMLKGSNCADLDSTPKYDYRRCTKKCLNQVVNSMGMENTVFTEESIPSEIINMFDWNVRSILKRDEMIRSGKVPATISLKEAQARWLWQASRNLTGNQLEDCYKNCTPPCDRTIYDVSFSKDEPMGMKEADGVSAITLMVKHTAVFQGGIMTLQEFETVTFSDFVSNIGGTLGLFLGCTVMTFSQIVMTVVSYLCGKR